MEKAESSMLCGPCSRLLKDAIKAKGRPKLAHYINISPGKPDEVIIGHHRNFESFYQSSVAGCHICSLLISQRTENEQHELRSRESRTGGAQLSFKSFADNHPQAFVCREITVYYDIYDYVSFDSESGPSFGNKTMVLQLWPTDEKSCPIGKEVETPSKWSVAAGWISACLREHKSCALPADSKAERPKRMIMVGEKPDFSDVCISDEVSSEESYITLSHCWGPQGVPIKLLDENRDLFSKQIPWEQLPKTFKDAIIIVRSLRPALGVYYLWIDALCIVQDSDEDKSAEIARMSGIYQNSLCNLAACLGPNSSSGLIVETESITPHECVIEAGQWFEPGGMIKVGNRNAYKVQARRGILASRAWVLQEVLLAPRVLYFTPEQMIWECSEACYHEADLRHNLTKEFETRLKYRPIYSLPSLVYSSTSWQFYSYWGECVKDYTRRGLTWKDDKLRAISAIAQVMEQQARGKDKYLIGLWNRQLHLHLAWSVERAQKSLLTGSLEKFPSWSWAGVDDAIEPHIFLSETLRNYKPLVELRPHVNHEDGWNRFDPQGLVALDITGTVYKVTILIDHDQRTQTKRFTSVWIKSGIPGAYYDDKDLGRRIDFTARLDYTTLSKPDSEHLWGEETHQGYLVFLANEHIRSYGERLEGILLTRVPERSGHYRRVGYCSADINVISIQHRDSYTLKEEDYVRDEGDQSYLITVL